MKIVVACTGNTCRSPMAAAILRRAVEQAGLTDVQIESAGISAFDSDPVSPHSVTAMERRHIDISGHKAKQLTDELINWADLVLVMTTGHKSYLESLSGTAGKVFTIKEYAYGGSVSQPDGKMHGDVPDPIGQPLAAYEQTAQELEVLADLIAQRLAK